MSTVGLHFDMTLLERHGSAADSVLEEFGRLLGVLRDLLRRVEHALLQPVAPEVLRGTRVERPLRLRDRRRHRHCACRPHAFAGGESGGKSEGPCRRHQCEHNFAHGKDCRCGSGARHHVLSR